jgi:rubrerythrin
MPANRERMGLNREPSDRRVVLDVACYRPLMSPFGRVRAFLRWHRGAVALPKDRRGDTVPMPVRVDFSKLTLMDALDLATLIEVEAFKRYTQFAEQLGIRYAGDAASVFQSMAVNENKHAEQLAQRRLALFGDERPKVKLDDIFDVEAPDFGAPTQNMSPLKAYWVALYSEKKAFEFYDQALRHVDQPDVKTLFEELRAEEAEHVQMLEAIIDKLPPSAKVDLEDEDEDAVPNSEGRIHGRF